MPVSIPDYNLFMLCPAPNSHAFAALPSPFRFDFCRPDELDLWKAFPFDDPAQAREYCGYMTDFFRTVYAPSGELFFSRCLFVRDPCGIPVGTAFLWRAYGQITTLHWFKVKPAYENNGIGRAILSRLLSDASPSDFPIYLHTQPASYRAIKLYTDFGFRLITDDIVGERYNHLRESLPILKEYLTDSAYANLTFSRAPAAFLRAAASSPNAEF